MSLKTEIHDVLSTEMECQVLKKRIDGQKRELKILGKIATNVRLKPWYFLKFWPKINILKNCSKTGVHDCLSTEMEYKVLK